VSVPPLLLAVADNLAILGIGLQLSAVIITPTPSLTIRLAANAPLRTIEARLEGMLTIAAVAKGAQVTTPQRFFLELIGVLSGPKLIENKLHSPPPRGI
jgi:hypothetical protein